MKRWIFDDVRRVFQLYGKEDALSWYENADPGTHNYQLDNRQQSYRFFTKHFGLPALDREVPVDGQINSYDELVVGLPKDNLTILGLARQRAGLIAGRPSGQPVADRHRLASVVRYKPLLVKHAWHAATTRSKGVASDTFRFQLSDGLPGAGVLFAAISAPDKAPVTIVLADKGRKSSAADVSDRVNRGERVLALDFLFRGELVPEKPGVPEYAQLLGAIGDRPLGIQTAHLIAISRWLRERGGVSQVRLEATGPRSQMTALVAAALEPALFSAVQVREGMRSLSHLLDAPVSYAAAPDLFCLDLYKEFDVDSLAALGKSTGSSELSRK